MAFAASLTDLQAEASCPLCLDFLRDPVTIDCGHNFCCSCITQCWEDLQDLLPCPVCLHHCLDRDLKRNTQLSHMTELVRQLPTRSGKRKRQEKKPLCEKHNRVVTLFCEKDLELLCAQCRVSSDHWDHRLMSIEQAAATHRKKLKSSMEPLKKEVEDAEKGLETQISESFKLKMKVEKQRLEFYSEFEQLMKLLGKEQDAILLGLMMEEEDLQEKLTENNMQISEHISTLKNMLDEITEKCVQSKVQLLTDIDSIYRSYENLKTPAVFSYELKKESCSLPPQYFGLQKMINRFKVDLTFDPETAHPSLIMSDNRKSVTYGKEEPNFPYNPKRFTLHPAVLSSEGFDSARHFWQVEVRGTGEWSLGVCKDSLPRNAIPSGMPKDGCWQIQQWTNTSPSLDTTKLIRIGIFLDYELGEVSFYNMHKRSHIYTFTDTFTEKLRPYFSTGPTANSLTISIITDEQ
ncbi:putative tripartite motif-containing protein 75 [Choloepus didactylus]|uniref:putative tripartite motif-containing protein 75 n=1 Tax=Choloepus didactylus TaxID=27675 RepID=UPI00189D9DF6|nr:putative tripartite motif-containing protein 75 [Choloepus didactylus]